MGTVTEAESVESVVGLHAYAEQYINEIQPNLPLSDHWLTVAKAVDLTHELSRNYDTYEA